MADLDALPIGLVRTVVCSLCGKHLLGTYFGEHDPIGAERGFTEFKAWSKSWLRRGYVYGKPADLKDVYFRDRWAWPRVYRAIVQTWDDGQLRHHLTGVALYGEWDDGLVRLPRNEDELILGMPWKAPNKFIEAYMGPLKYPETDIQPCGYPVHERCWVLMTRILDINLIKAHLDVFVKTLCERYRFLHPRNIGYDEDNIYELGDPLNIIEVRDLLKKAQKVDQQQSKKSNPTKSPRRSSPAASSFKYWLRSQKGTHRLGVRRTKILLPPEIILIIMDMLPCCKEVWTLLFVFPQWRPMIPQRYWRARFVKNLMLEYEEVPELGAVDWQNLYFKVDDLSTKSRGLRARWLIMHILEGTKELFLKYVTDETIVKC